MLGHTPADDEAAGCPSVSMQFGEKMTGERVGREKGAAVESAARRMKIMRADLEKYGFTAGCLGWRA